MTTTGCPVCGRTNHRSWKASDVVEGLTPEDLAITDRRYGTTLGLRECACGFRSRTRPRSRTSSRSTRRSTIHVRGGPRDPGHPAAGAARGTRHAAPKRAHPARRRRRKRAPRGGRDAAGLDAVGVEPSESLAAAAHHAGSTCAPAALAMADLADRRFDLVTLVDVVEHVGDPVALLAPATRRWLPAATSSW